MADFEKLEGGNFNQVRRHGKTVIRQCGVWSPFVHQLLQFLTVNNFAESPALLESTDTTETLTFIEGDVGNEPLQQSMLSDQIIVEAGQLLRRFHDLTQDFPIPSNAHFLLPVDAHDKHEVVCHNDFAPYNCVYRDGHLVGIIDFDTAAPGQRIWDIAYAVYRFVPLSTDEHCLDAGWSSPPDRATRLKLFCDAYGLEDRTDLIETVIKRIEALLQFMRDKSLNLHHIPIYEDDIQYIQQNQQALEDVLTT